MEARAARYRHVVNSTGSDVVITDGPFGETKEHLGGFWIYTALRTAKKRTVDTTAVAAFRAASLFFVQAVAAVPPDRYEQPWSDEWRVLDLIGHGNRANLLPVEYYERPVQAARPEDLAEYLLPENIAKRGREATAVLGDDPLDAVRSASERVLAVIASAPDIAVVGTPFGERSLDSYLPSRTAELVLHGLDLDTSVVPPAEALAGCTAFLVSQAVGSGRGVDVVRALSGRGTLAPGFNVY